MKPENQFINETSLSSMNLAGKKILFANFPADGHFNPLTGLAAHLQQTGCDVRWYTSSVYAEKIKKLQIIHYPFKKAKDVNGENIESMFPERAKIKGVIKKLNFDIINAFVLRGQEYYADLVEIYKEFPFELVVSDCAFTGIPFITDKMNLPVVSIGVLPLPETSKDLAPTGLGITPSYSFFGKMKQALLRFVADKILFGKPNKVMRQIMEEYGIDHFNFGIFDLMIKKATIFLQSGTPGFEYYRSDLGQNIRFIGSLLPYQSQKQRTPWYNAKLNRYEKIVIVTQGTVEKNTEKIIVPTLEAFKNTDVLVIATTGGSGTADLQKRFQQENFIIEDFIPFADIMPYADVYVTNGGYGGVMLGIEHQLPLVVAGVHEGKNEINARIGYFKLGVNLKTEIPKAAQIRKAVDEVLKNNLYKQNIIKLGKEFSGYNPNELTEYYIKYAIRKSGSFQLTRQEEKIY
ncbi:MAG TPA: nucleotide disphospho-sugar-binding domain-containing protein [Chitinophagaceae bacterium]